MKREAKKKKLDTATLRRVISLITPERGYLAAALLFAAVNVALTLTCLLYTSRCV